MSGKKDKLEDSLEALFSSFPGSEREEEKRTSVVEELEPLEEELKSLEDTASGEQEQADPDPTAAPPPPPDEPGAEKREGPEEAPEQAEEEKSRAAAEPPQQPPGPPPDQPADSPEMISLDESEPEHGSAAVDISEPEKSEEAPRPRVFEEGERVVVFCLEKESFGVDIYSIRTLVKPQAIFPVPHMPDYLVGLTNLRGEIVPVIDLRTRLGLCVSEYTESTRFVVAEKRDEPICLIVDDVFGIENFSPEHLEEPSGVISSVDTTYLHAIAKLKENLVLLLDLDQVLGEKILEFKK